MIGGTSKEPLVFRVLIRVHVRSPSLVRQDQDNLLSSMEQSRPQYISTT
jgi:hypothetical protein